MHAPAPTPEWYVISLRPAGAHAGLRRAAARCDAGLIALSPWRLRGHDDYATRQALHAALAAPRVLFTSPAAVRAARALQPLADAGGSGAAGRHWFAIGAGTAAALRRAGLARVQAPRRMDSEGLLALPGLQDVAGTAIGLVTAPGGRGLITPVLQERGARVLRADVYVREPVAPAPRAVAALVGLQQSAVLALSSGEALQRMLAVLPPAAATRLRACTVAAASPRLAALAREAGFAGIVLAAGPRPRQLVEAAARALQRSHPLA